MKIIRYLFTLALFSLFLIAGLNAGRLMNALFHQTEPSNQAHRPAFVLEVKSHSKGFQSQHAPTLAPPVPNVGAPEPVTPSVDITPEPFTQKNILLIGVDDLTAGSPHLEGVWLVLYLTHKPHFTLMPIYPVPAEDGQMRSQDADLEKLFNSDQPAFFSQLQDQGIWWEGYYIFDRHALSQITDRVVGLSQVENQVSSTSIAEVPLALNDPQSASEGQFHIVSALCNSAGSLTEKHISALADLFLLFSDHITSDISREQAAAELVSMLAMGSPISCEFPSLSLAEHLP